MKRQVLQGAAAAAVLVCLNCSAATETGGAPLPLGLSMNGAVRVGDTDATLEATIFHEGWGDTSTGVCRGQKFPDAATGTAEVEFFGKRYGKLADGRVALRATGDGAAAYAASLTSVRDERPELVALVLAMPGAAFAGAAWTRSDGVAGVLPKTWDGKTTVVWNDVVSWVELAPPGQSAFRISFPAPTRVLLQDNRRWVPSFCLRIWPRQGGGREFAAGETRTFACSVSAAGGVAVSVDAPVTVSAGPDWIPLDYRKDVVAGSALDFSGQGLQDAPAGKYGWLKNEGGHFAFERRPGVRQRLYGVNLCFDANYPDREFADRLVTRLVRLGYNAVRIHHYERDLVAGSEDGLALNAGRAERLDYLLAKCFEKGIYATTDLFTSRPVAWRAIGIDRDGAMDKKVYKNMILVHDGAFRNWAAFAKNFLTHVNPYTGRAYKDEPALPLLALINEGHLTWCWSAIRDEEAMKTAWAKWLASRRKVDPSFAKGMDDIRKASVYSEAGIAFMAEIEREGVRRMTDFLRKELGVKALFTNQNCGGHYAPLLAVAEDLYDYVDDHFYVDHPHFLGKSWSLPSRCGNGNPVLGGSMPVQCAFTRMPTKPFTITEWNFSGPGMFRGVGGVMTGAFAALQGWDGLWRFAYSHGLSGMRDRTGHPGYFDVATDPLMQAGDRASVCLFLRGDLGPLADGVAQRIAPASLKAATGASARGVVPAWSDAAWQVRTATTMRSADGFRTVGLEENFADAKPPVALRPNPAVALDRARGTFRVVTERTTGGFAPSGALRAGDVAFDVGDVPATVWASSLDGKPIAQSRRILVTHLTDVQANGNVYAEPAKRTLLKWGSYPPVVRNGRARVCLALDEPDGFAVWALETDGTRAERVPGEVRNGRLYFTADVKGAGGARMLYEVVNERGNGE